MSFIFFNFSNEIMYLFYKTTKGALFVKIMAIPSFVAYFEGVFVSSLIAIDKEKKLVISTILTNVIHLTTIFILVSIPYFNAMGLVISFSMIMILSTLILYKLCRKENCYKLDKKKVLLFLVIYALFMSLSYFL